MFENISIGIKTFLRDPQLFNAIESIRTNLSGAQMIIVDCGEMTEEKEGIYADLEREGHQTIQLPFDAGFGSMSNAITDAVKRQYLLIGSDDFDFSTQEVRIGIAKLKEVLDLCSDVDIASGRVNNRPYEFDLIDDGDKITEVPVKINWHGPIFPWYVQCDLTVNYGLFRKLVFEKVRWDDDVKIGGAEHGAQFVKLKRAGFKTVFVPNVNINEQKICSSERYKQFRNRANNLERPCFDRIGVRRYILGDGRIDYDKRD
jgi:hypothetical protein